MEDAHLPHRRSPPPASVRRTRRRRLSDVDPSLTEAAYAFIENSVEFGRGDQVPWVAVRAAQCTLQLPVELKEGLRHDLEEFVNTALFDQYMTRNLEQSKAINWAGNTGRLVALRTEGDGNCLMHAASLAMWGVHDRSLTLRRAVYQALRRDPGGRLRQRWRRCRSAADRQIDLELEPAQWETEWHRYVVELCSDKSRVEPSALPYGSLDEFHVFVLAQVLRRPVIVFADETLASVHGEQLAPVHMGGLYLPVERRSDECVRTPLMIAYEGGHFTGVVLLSGEPLVPLHRSNMQRLPMHFLLEGEEKMAERLLEVYLDRTVTGGPQSGPMMSFQPLNVARLSEHSCPEVSALSLTYGHQLDTLFMEDQAARCRTPKCTAYHAETSEFCSGCNQKRSKAATAPQTFVPGQTLVPCEGKDCGHLARSNSGGKNLCDVCKTRLSTTASTGLGPAVSSAPQLSASKIPASSSSVSHTAPPRSGSPSLCTSPGCKFHGSPELNGMCSACFKIYSAKDAKDSREQRRQAATAGVGEGQTRPQRCLHPGCIKAAHETFRSFCAEHFEQKEAEQRAKQSGGEAPRPKLTCRTPNCPFDNLEWGSFCHVCLVAMADDWLKHQPSGHLGSSTVPPPVDDHHGDAALQRQMSEPGSWREGPPLKCSTPHCDLDARLPENYCTLCLQRKSAEASSSSAQRKMSEPGSWREGPPSKCSTPHCNFDARLPENYCAVCLQKKRAEASSSSAEMVVLRCKLRTCKHVISTECHRRNNGFCDRCFQDSNGESNHCVSPGCPYFGSADRGGLCSTCYSHRQAVEQERLREQRAREQQREGLRDHQRLTQHHHQYLAGQQTSGYFQPCVTCDRRTSSPNGLGLCDLCFQEARRTEEQTQFRTAVR